MRESKQSATAKSEAHELFKMRNEYFVENDRYEEVLELRVKRKVAQSTLNPLKKGVLQCRTCQP